jgi:two-component system alkaline phosphatase synthesis response regulator PhoP
VDLDLKHQPHLILLDVMMPEMDGIETCEELRKHPALENTIIAFLTARGEDYSQIAGFEAGGDDYIVKPIKPKVLTSRIHALLKRTTSTVGSRKEEKENIVAEDIVLDREKEFELLALLISSPGKVFQREEIFSKVWGDDIIVGDRTIDVHIRKLRKKIGADHIKTIKGVGYKFT